MHKKAFDETERLIKYLKGKGITEVTEDDLARFAAEVEVIDSAYLMDYWKAIIEALGKEGIKVIPSKKASYFKGLQKEALNDILNKGFNNVRQECYLRINNPELADQIFREHGHAHDWNKLKLDDWNRFWYVDDGGGKVSKKSAFFCNKLQKIADRLDAKGKSIVADKIDNLIKQIASLK